MLNISRTALNCLQITLVSAYIVSCPKTRDTEQLYRAESMYRIASLVKDYRKDVGKNPETIAQIWSHALEKKVPIKYLRELFWPKIAAPTLGNCPDGWDPSNPMEQQVGAYVVIGDPNTPEIISESPAFLRGRENTMSLSRDELSLIRKNQIRKN